MPRVELRKIKHVSKVDLAEGQPLTIGRSSQNTIVLHDTHVSRNHCLIELVNGAARVRDLESHGGTFINGKRIKDARIGHGDRVSVGPFDLVFKDPLVGAREHDNGSPAASSSGPSVALDDAEPMSDQVEPPHSQRLAELESQLEAKREQSAEAAKLIAEMTSKRESAQTRAAELERHAAELDAANRSQADQIAKLERRLADLDTEKSEQADRAADLEAALSEARNREELAEQIIATRDREIADLSAAIRSAEVSFDERAVDAQRALAHAQATLTRTVEQLEHHKDQEQQLRRRVQELEREHRQEAEQRARSAAAMAAMQNQIRALDQAARRVAALQDQLARLESTWGDVEQTIDHYGDGDTQQLATAQQARQVMISEIDALNEQRDAAVVELRQSAQRLRALTERHELMVAESRPALSISPSARKWWKFGGKD